MSKKVSSTIKIFDHVLKKLTDAQITALVQTADYLIDDVREAQVVPRDTTHLQGDAMTVDSSRAKTGTVSVVHQTPYARRLYFHPEYNFSKKGNPNARGKWFEPWEKGGEKEDFCKKKYAELFKQLGGL